MKKWEKKYLKRNNTNNRLFVSKFLAFNCQLQNLEVSENGYTVRKKKTKKTNKKTN